MEDHTPEPWVVGINTSSRTIITAPRRHLSPSSRFGTGDEPDVLASFMGETHIRKANAARAAACVNGCKGINPEAVPDLIGAVESAIIGLASGKGSIPMILSMLKSAMWKADRNRLDQIMTKAGGV